MSPSHYVRSTGELFTTDEGDCPDTYSNEFLEYQRVTDERIAKLEAELEHIYTIVSKGIDALKANPIAKMAMSKFGVDPESFNADSLRR